MSPRYGEKGVIFVFVYTREAHPAEPYVAHRSLEQKIAQARAFKEAFHIERPMLVDDLIGTGHRQYGILSNMTYLIGRGGKVLFRADWTDPPTIERVLDYVIESRAHRREGLRMAPFYAELVGYRLTDSARQRENRRHIGLQPNDDPNRIQRYDQLPGRITLDE